VEIDNTIAIVGLGWLGAALANQLKSKGFQIKGSTTSNDKRNELSKHYFYIDKIKIEAHNIEGDWTSFISNISLLIINIPPKQLAICDTLYSAQIQQIINQTPQELKVIFISSTSVYGKSETPFIETSITEPIKISGIAILKAEQLLRPHFGEQLTILRLAGLIGPERHPGKFLAGKNSLKQPLEAVNLIHREDAIGLIETIIDKSFFGEIINGCASKHPTRKVFYEKATKVLNLEPPIFQPSNGTSALKIIDNSKSKIKLGYQYIYDDPELIFYES